MSTNYNLLIVVLGIVALIITPTGAASLTNYSVGTGDGWFENTTSQNFLPMVASEGSYVSTAGTSITARTIADTTANNYTSVARFYVQFDTSAIPDASDVDGAVVYLYLTSKQSTFSGTPFGVALYGYTPTTYGTGVEGDYSLGGTTAYSNIIPNSSLTSSAYNAFTISDLTSINKTGYTVFMGKLNLDANGTAPVWEASKTAAANFASSESTHDPYIEVTYIPPGAYHMREKATSTLAKIEGIDGRLTSLLDGLGLGDETPTNSTVDPTVLFTESTGVFTDILGPGALVLLFLIPFSLLFISQRSMRGASVLGVLVCLFVFMYLPANYQAGAVICIVISVGALGYSLWKGQG